MTIGGGEVSDFDGAVDAYRRALVPFLHGHSQPVEVLYSRRADVTLANPLGPARRGWSDVEQIIRSAAAHFTGGTLEIDELARYGTADLGYVVQTERSQVHLAGSGEPAMITLRVTMIFRREGNRWKVAHRHADPITNARPIATATRPKAGIRGEGVATARAEEHLAAIASLSRALNRKAIDYWLFGGWAVDFWVGRVTREHDDVDIAAWRSDYDAIGSALQAADWRHTPVPDEVVGTRY